MMALRLRFRLRTLLIVICVCAVGFGWLGYRMRQVQRQEDTLEEIRRLGGVGVCERQFDISASESMTTMPPGMEMMFLHLYHAGDVGIFSSVVAIDLSFVDWRFASNEGGQISAEEFLEIGGIDMIALVNDENLKCLDQLPHLRWLRLENTHVSDKSLDRLGSIKTLEWLNLHNTLVTEAGVEELRRKLPNCEILWSPPGDGRSTKAVETVDPWEPEHVARSLRSSTMTPGPVIPNVTGRARPIKRPFDDTRVSSNSCVTKYVGYNGEKVPR